MNSRIIALGAMALLLLGITGATVGGHLASMKANQFYPSRRVSSLTGSPAPAAAQSGASVAKQTGSPGGARIGASAGVQGVSTPAVPRSASSASGSSAAPAATAGLAAGGRTAHSGGVVGIAQVAGKTFSAGAASRGDD